MKTISHFFYDKFILSGMSVSLAEYLNMTILLVGLLLILFIIDFLTSKIIVVAFNRFSEKTNTNFDNILVKNKAPRNIAHIIPVIIAGNLFENVFIHFESVKFFAGKA